MMDKIENFMNELTDMDWGWWPVLFLRPTKNKNIDNVILLKLSLIFGSVIGVFLLWLAYWKTGILALSTLLLSIPLGWLLFFVIYKFTFVYFWNRRARRLRGE